MIQESEIKTFMAGKEILILEDDSGLAKRLMNIFQEYGAKVNIKHYIDAGLEELQKKGTEYDLIIVDVMLARTKEDFEKISKYREEVDTCVNVLMQEEEYGLNDTEYKKVIEDARQRRSFLLGAIVDLVTNDGGIEVIEKWIKGISDSKRPGILYLTAVGTSNMIEKGKNAAEFKKVEWLVKPITPAKLILMSIELMK
jgi:CheY-like chemotaxis protein